jgi:hypothetical protein
MFSPTLFKTHREPGWTLMEAYALDKSPRLVTLGKNLIFASNNHRYWELVVAKRRNVNAPRTASPRNVET